jgi:predicted ATPase
MLLTMLKTLTISRNNVSMQEFPDVRKSWAVESLEVYIPPDRRLAIAREVSLPDRAYGAVLFADVSGFTPLTDALVRELGPRRGAEELPHQLNRVYNALIAEVDRYKGSVIFFSGDAITCWFDERDNPLSGGRGGEMKHEENSTFIPHPSPFILYSASFQAVACALRMQQAMAQFAAVQTPSGATVSLTIKIAVTAGPVRRFLVGDPHIQYLDVLAGKTLDRMARLEQHARKGEILVAPEIVAQLGDRLRIAAWRKEDEAKAKAEIESNQRFAVITGLIGPTSNLQPSNSLQFPSIPSVPFSLEELSLTEAQTRPWLLPPVYERLKAGRGRFLAELRMAIAFFISFKGLDYDQDDAAGDKLDAYIRWVQNILAHHEGYLLQLTIGDKGSYLYATFGAPLAHGDDASRAVAAALELQSLPPSLNFITDIQIGLSQGRMRVGAYGNQTRRTYGVLGSEVNMAARLMSRAKPGQILISKHVAEAAAKNFQFKYLATMPVKGRTEPIPIFEVTGRHASPLPRPTSLVGREKALTQLGQVLESVSAGAGQVLRIEGVASVGKSHLAADFIEQAISRGFQVARGFCQRPEQSITYGPWQQIFWTWFDLSDAPPLGENPAVWTAQQIAQVEAAIKDINPDWLPLLPLLGDLLGLPIPDNETTIIFVPLLRQGTLFALAMEMIKTWTHNQASLLIIDDAHWLDEASQGLLLALSRTIATVPILLTLVHRSSDHPHELLLPDLNQLPHYNHLNLHGKAEPVAVDRSQGQKLAVAPPAIPPTMIGRSAERMLLTGQLQALVRGNTAGTVIIEGEAGIGKSRLVADLLEQAQALDVTYLIGGGDAIERSTPYHAWRPLFRQLFNLDTRSKANTIARRTQVLSLLPAAPELLRLAPLLNAVLPLSLQENNLTREMTGQVRADNTCDLLLNLLQAAVAQSPTLIILEDAHWLDSASWALTRLVSQQVRPVLLIIVSRPMADPLPTEYHQLLQASSVQQLRLEALSSEEILTLICQRLGVKTLPQPITALILAKAEGHPFFSEELAYALRDAGVIRIAEGECQPVSEVEAFDAVTLPDTIEEVITSRIDRLSSPQQLILKVASVIGHTFLFDLLHDIHPIEVDKPHLLVYLDSLTQLDITRLDTPRPALTYTFRHVITREVAYNLMLFDQRRELHRTVAEWFEHTYADDLNPFYPLLAYHWSQAIGSQTHGFAVVVKAIDYLEKAGEQALRSYANQEAVRFLSQAISILKAHFDEKEQGGEISSAPPAWRSALAVPRSPAKLRQSRWQRQLGEAYLGLGQLAESRNHLEQAVALLGWSQSAQRVRYVTGLLGQVLRQVSHRLGPVNLVQGSLETKATLLEAARTYERLGEIYYWSNETLPAIYAALCTLNLAERAGPSPELARAYANMCLVAGFASLRSLADSYSRRAQAAAQEAQHQPALAWVLELTGVYAIGIGQWAKARDTLERGRLIAAELEDRRRWEECTTALTEVSYFQGKFADSLKLWPDIYASARQRSDTQAQSWGLAGQLRSCLALGELHTDQTKTALKELEILASQDIGSADQINSYGVVALVRLRLGEAGLAWQAAEVAASLMAQSSPTGFGIIHGYNNVAEVYLTLWEAESILDFRQKAHGVWPILDLAKFKDSNTETPLRHDVENLKSNAWQACQALHKYARAFPVGQPRAWLWQGLYDWLSGQPATAYRAWRKSLTKAEHLAMPYEHGLAYYEIGRHLPLDDPARRVHLTRATEIFSQINTIYDLTRTEQALTMSC